MRSTRARSQAHAAGQRRRAWRGCSRRSRSNESPNFCTPSASSVSGDVVVVDARLGELRRAAAWAFSTPFEHRVAAHLAVILERLDRLERHRVHRVGPDQLLDVDHVAVVGVLGRRRRPQAALLVRALPFEILPARSRERLEKVLVRELRVRDRELALQLRMSDGIEALVGLGVDARDEERRDRRDLRRVAAAGDEPLEPAHVRLDDRLVAVEREDQRDVDRGAVRGAVLDRRQTRLRRRDLHVEVRAVDLGRDPARLLERLLGVVGDSGLDLHRDVAVDPARRVVRGPEHVARLADVLQREREEDLRRIVRLGEQLLQVLVVRVALRQRLLEDRRVRRDAGDGVVLHHPLQLARVDEIARERVEPHRLPARRELMRAVTSPLPSFIILSISATFASRAT